MPSHVGTAIFCLGLILAHAYCQSTPFTGSPVNLPGVIHAANFDRGGEGVGYHDVDAANLGGEYRLAEGVDIGRCRDTASQGYSIGWTRAGEWMQYTVNIATTATYQMNVRYASNGGGGTAHFEQNGVDVTGPISFGTTGDWQNWATHTVSARLTAANNAKLRMVYDSVGSTGSVANFNFFNVTATGASSAPVSPFKLQTEYAGNNFFDGFNFFSAPDPTHGYVTYVNRDVATSASLARVTASGQILMAVDNSSIASGAGRRAVRIESKANYNGGLFVLDVEHMPTGCGTWPAYWLNGPNWPNGGEIDIFEGVNKQSATVSVLHTNPGCAMYNMDASKMTGTWIARNCYVQAPGQSANQGCSLNGPAGSFGAPFNAGKGGHHATIWDSTGISMWFWPRGTAPSDLQSGNPLPATWGKPYGRFDFGTECPSSHFSNHRIIMNIALCGDWAGNVFGSQCPGLGSCQSYVQNNPRAFSEAFWLLNSIRVYQPK